jgi:hypothetical protein
MFLVLFRIDLTQNQADKLWDCLTSITGTTGTNREELYNWLLSQLKNRDGGHALSLETFKHLLTQKVLFENLLGLLSIGRKEYYSQKKCGLEEK